MLEQLIAVKSSRKSVGAEKIARSQKHMATKKEPDYSGSFSF